MINDDTTIDAERQTRRLLRKAAAVFVFLFLVVAFTVGIVRSNLQRQRAERDFAALEHERDDLRQLAGRLDVARRLTDQDKQVIWNVLRQSRTADDIPNLKDDHIVSQNQGADGLTFYLPKGSHRFELSAVWYDNAIHTSTPESEDELMGSGNWMIPLQGESGYMLMLTRDPKGDPVGWELTSNHPQFESRSEIVFPDKLTGSGWSYSGDNVIAFPNQVQNMYKFEDLEAAAVNPPGVKIFNVKLSGKQGEQSIAIKLTAVIKSDGPAVAGPGNASSILARQRGDLLKPYAGDGKYELKRPDEHQ